jgi:hypothetical protein
MSMSNITETPETTIVLYPIFNTAKNVQTFYQLSTHSTILCE